MVVRKKTTFIQSAVEEEEVHWGNSSMRNDFCALGCFQLRALVCSDVHQKVEAQIEERGKE